MTRAKKAGCRIEINRSCGDISCTSSGSTSNMALTSGMYWKQLALYATAQRTRAE